jgi:signal transduction histidine kinase
MIKTPPILFVLLFIFCCTPQENKTSNSLKSNNEVVKLYEKTKLISRTKKDSLSHYHSLFSKFGDSEDKTVLAMYHNVNALQFKADLYFELAKNELKTSLQLAHKNSLVYADAIFELGVNYKKTTNYKEALNNYFKALKIYKKLNTASNVANVNAEIGEIYMIKNDSDLAKKYLTKSTDHLKADKINPVYLKASQTLANVYGMNGEFSKALEIDKEGVHLSDSIQSDFFKVTFLNNKANCFLYSGQLDSAKVYFDKCLKIDLKLGNKPHIADSYTNLSQWAFFSKDYPAAIGFMQKSIAIYKPLEDYRGLYTCFNVLSDIYFEASQPEKAYEAKKEALSFYKKLVDEKQVKSVSELEIVYQTEEKEKLLLQKTFTEKKRNITILVLTLLIMLIIIIAYLIYSAQRNKNKQLKKEQELNLALSQIETQNKLQNQRLEISRDLHDTIGAQLTFIISSIDNLKYGFTDVSSKVGNKLSYISTFTKDTIYELRDTIWAMNKDEITVEDLNARISNFITNANTAAEHINFSFISNLKEEQLTSFNSKTGMNIYRIIQEATNNAIKHAEASKINVEVQSEGNTINISIKDNGKGFDNETVEKGNGLQSIQKRAQDLKADLNIINLYPGTEIKLILNNTANDLL